MPFGNDTGGPRNHQKTGGIPNVLKTSLAQHADLTQPATWVDGYRATLPPLAAAKWQQALLL